MQSDSKKNVDGRDKPGHDGNPNFYLFLPSTGQNFARTAGAEMAEFLEGGKTIRMSLAPEYGGNVQALQQEVMGAVLTGDYDKVSELLHAEIVTD